MFGEKKFGLNIPQKINKKLSEIRKIFKGNLEPGWPWIKLEQVKPGLAMTGTVLAAISDAKKRVLRFEVIYASTYDAWTAKPNFNTWTLLHFFNNITVSIIAF